MKTRSCSLLVVASFSLMAFVGCAWSPAKKGVTLDTFLIQSSSKATSPEATMLQDGFLTFLVFPQKNAAAVALQEASLGPPVALPPILDSWEQDVSVEIKFEDLGVLHVWVDQKGTRLHAHHVKGATECPICAKVDYDFKLTP